MSDSDSLISGYLHWHDQRLKGRLTALDAALSEHRGMSVEEGLHRSVETFGNRAERTTNKPAVRRTAARNLAMTRMLMAHPDVRDRPTGVDDLARRFHGLLQAGVSRVTGTTEELPGSTWYFQHRRQQAEHVDPAAELSGRQVTAISAKLSASKNPVQETMGLQGITRLAGSHARRLVDRRRISSIPSHELAAKASAASTWSAYEDPRQTASFARPTAPKPHATPEVMESLRLAGQPHEHNVRTGLQIARKEITPKEAYGESTPKTGPYAEMQAQAHPGGEVEADVRNISSHYRDVTAGTQSRGQGMFVFSQAEGAPRHHMLDPSVPAAIDTWMVAAGSGQPLKTKPARGKAYSPAKRMTDKDFPLAPDASTKSDLGLLGTPASVTGEAATSAQHNEALRRVSMSMVGQVSHDQYGRPIHLPKSVVQGAVWTETRKQAGADPEFNAQERARAKQGKGNRSITQRSSQGTLF